MGEQLETIVRRIESLELDRRTVAGDIRDIYAEAKSGGLDVKTLRQIVRIRRQGMSTRAEQEAMLDTYLHALGMLADMPLGQAALRREFGAAAT